MSVNIRIMTEEQRRIGHALLQNFLNAVGNYVSGKPFLLPADKKRFDSMKQAFLDYNEWLKR